MWSFTIEPNKTSMADDFMPPPDPSQKNEPDQTDPWNLARLDGELEKMKAHIATLPQANNPDVVNLLGFLDMQRERLRLAQAEELANQKMRQEKLDNMRAETDARRAAHEKRKEEMNKPLEPLDGNALGRALLKNLGFTE
jgi:hypothetical protein